MKSVLLSIRPKWCEKICREIGKDKNGKLIYEKQIEVRKGKPREVPCRVFIYETKNSKGLEGWTILGTYRMGKVIGEFVCDKITTYAGEFWDDETEEEVRERYEPSDFDEFGEYEYPLLSSRHNDDEPLKGSGLSWEDCREYFGKGDCTFYGWHISDLKIYDKPKELSEFRKMNGRPIKRAYQSWGYCCDEKEN